MKDLDNQEANATAKHSGARTALTFEKTVLVLLAISGGVYMYVMGYYEGRRQMMLDEIMHRPHQSAFHRAD